MTECALDTAYLDLLLGCRNLTMFLQSYRHDFLVLSLLQTGASGSVPGRESAVWHGHLARL